MLQIVRQLSPRALLTRGMLPLLILAIAILFASIEPRFVAYDNLFNLGRQATYLLIITMGQTLALLAAGFDLSVGAITALTSVTTALTMSAFVGSEAAGMAVVVGIGVGVLVGGLVGLINGLVIAYLRVSPLVVTLGMASACTGVALLLTGGAPVGGLPRAFTSVLGVGRWLGIPVPVYVAAAILIGIHFVLNRSRTGRYMYAIGGNVSAARLSGISVERTTILVYLLCGALAGVAGILLTARVASGEANLGGSFALESITAAVLGGVSLRGGEGRLANAVTGVIFVVMLQNGMNLIRIPSYVQMIVLGVALVGAVILDHLRKRGA